MKRVVSSFLFAVGALCVLPTSALAEEGMWMPQQIPQLAPRLRALGWTGDPKQFADLTGHPMGAIVSLGGCSASFVSPDGLIVTNHHCVAGALQFNSTPQRNLLVDGFLARERGDELFAGPGSRVFVTVSVQDVTADLQRALPAKLDDRARYDAVENWVKQRTTACEKTGLRCRVQSFFGGAKWFELAQMEIQDVRLVYAPPAGIGNFGGETDNWQWPRHTGDFSFYRAYVGKDGKPAPFAKDNVPFHPKQWLKINPKGIAPGDVVFVAGYPGRTERLQTYAEVKSTAEWGLPRILRTYKDMLAIIEGLEKNDPELAIKLAGRKRGLNNGLTKDAGVLEGLNKGGLLALKEKQEKELRAWIAANPARQVFAAALDGLDALQAAEDKTRERDAALTGTAGGSSLLSAAMQAYRFSLERPKPDAAREPEFQERNWTRIREGLERMQKTYDARADRAFLRYALLLSAALPADQRVAPIDEAAGFAPGMDKAAAEKAAEAFLDKLYGATKLGDKAARAALLQADTATIQKSDDPFVQFALKLYPAVYQLRENGKTREGARYRLAPVYLEALTAKNGGLLAPDANSTLRVTYGTVKGVSTKDGLMYLPQTTLAGVEQKATGTGEFNAPARELAAIAALRAGKKTPYLDPKLKDVPVDFLSTVDTTGGNSGSATLNARGELVGLLFDGTYDTVASDYLFDTVRTRSIHADVRYMLWTLAEVDQATNLLRELGF